MLKNYFITLLSKFTDDEFMIMQFWVEIEKSYSNKKRFYHNLTHIENLISQLLLVKKNIKNWDTLLFSAFYHDIIYNTLKSDNEEKSALLAQQRLTTIHAPKTIITDCINQILATKTHFLSTNEDTNYFTDADLSILGQEWDIYQQYIHNIRQEYAIYPDLVYNSGRKKVLSHFLSMENIYKTPFFLEKYEYQAANNLKKELEFLT